MAYSTMNWCQCIVLIIITCMDLGMMLYSYCSNAGYKAVIGSHWFSKMGFWLIIAFYIFKLILSMTAYVVWKRDFVREHNHSNCCGAVVPPYLKYGHTGNSEIDNPGRPLHSDHSDNERGSRLPFQAFQGSGQSIGGGGGGVVGAPQRGFNQNPNYYAQPQRSAYQQPQDYSHPDQVPQNYEP